jgi:RNA polymerase sigma-70 factor (ECF subfamily)
MSTTLERFAAGDLVAFEALFREFQGPVFGWIMRIVRDRGAAEELTVETFWRAWNARARFDPSREFGAWARRIASNLALNHLKKPGVAAAASAAGARERAPLHDTHNPAIDAERRAAIERAFRELPPKLQAAATLALIEEEPYDEIARGLGITVNGVKSRVFRAVRILRKKLEWIRID